MSGVGGPAIRASGLRKRYGDVEAVRGIDFSVAPGQCYGLLGPNGAGKTSTINVITGRGTASGGSLEVLGLDVLRVPEQVRARIGVVPQENNLDPDLTLRENLEIYARYFGIDGRTAARRTAELLAFVQLEGKSGVRVGELSGGMKRRAVIARALLNNPELVILDEPTTGLDPQARFLVWERLRELRRRGVTLLLTTHYMDEAWRLCDRVLIIDEGLVIAEGEPRGLVAERVSRWVLELPELVPDDLPAAARALIRRAEQVGHTLYAYSEDNEAVLTALRAAGTSLGQYLARPANLEDLFLLLTGREMRE